VEGPLSRRALFVPAGGDRRGSPRRVFGGLKIDAKVLPGDTAGALFVIEHRDEGKGGPPRHLHREQEEWFYVLEGEYRAEVGAERFELGPGGALLAPRGVPHVWAHVGEGAGRLLIAFSPAGEMDAFLAVLSELGASPSPEALRLLFAAHGMEVVGPPLSVP
jgi:quercetin dioxygenase-like cupin family protein